MTKTSAFRRAVLGAFAALLIPVLASASPRPVALRDHARAVNILPPGQSGHMDLATFGLATAGAGDYGVHYDDQREMYERFEYKSMQFKPGKPWTKLGDATLSRDPYGVPQVYASTRDGMMAGFGYAMASDRLFQMDLFRRAGHGRLAEILGEGYVPFDAEVRTLSEGAQARARELARASRRTRADLEAFSRGVNAYITDATLDPSKMPAEFVLLGDVPIAPWTPDDTLAFGEYAGRYFGEFGHGEIEMAATLQELTQVHGAEKAHQIFDDIYPLDDPNAPTTIPASDATFPRHSAPPTQTEVAVVNTTLSAGVAETARAMRNIQATTTRLRRAVGLHGFGSNQYLVGGRRSATGNAMVVSEPQTGWAVPSFLWEVELHGPGYHSRGVTVPGLSLMVIGRNEDSGWAVTSGLDANADTFVETLSADGTKYLFNREERPIEVREESIRCGTPPTILLELPETGTACSTPVRTLTVRRTVHGPMLLEPDVANRVAYTRRSVVDGNIVASLEGWSRFAEIHDVDSFLRASSKVAFSFNFMFAAPGGNIAYAHVGRYPLRPADVDERLPIPGTGAFEWAGYESFADQPHIVNPPTGFLANWNNKPAAGWRSKPQLYHTFIDGLPYMSHWGPGHQVEPIQHDLARIATGITFENMGQIQAHVATVDNRARAWMPTLLAAIDASGEEFPGREVLGDWDMRRVDVDHDGFYDKPALRVFDLWVEEMLRVTFEDDLGSRIFAVSSGIGLDGHLRSADNGDTPTFKLENSLFATLDNAIAGRGSYDFFNGTGAEETMVAVLRKVIDGMGGEGLDGRQRVERGAFAAQGAGSVEDLAPLINRGSYGHIVESGGAPTR